MENLISSNLTVSEEFDGKACDYLVYHSCKNTTMGMHESLRRSIVESLVHGHGKLLEVGCGPGWYIERLSKYFQCYGIDISFNMLKECRKKSLKTCMANGYYLPFLNDTFDYVICINMLSYVDRPVDFLNEISRVAKKNCVLVLDFKNKISLRCFIHTLYSKFRAPIDSDKEKRFSIFEFLKFLKASGWTIVKVFGAEFDFLPTSRKPQPIGLINLLTLIDKWLSPSPFKYVSGRIFLMLQ